MISPLLFGYGPSCILCIDNDLDEATASLLMRLAHTPSENLPIRLGSPHKVFTQEWWQSGVPNHRLEAWKEWGFQQLKGVVPQKTIEQMYDGATYEQQCALILASEPLLLTHVNTVKQEDGSLKSPVAEMDVKNPATNVNVDTAIISKAPLKKKLVMAIKHADLAGLSPSSCLKISKDGQTCEHPTALLSPLWQAAIETMLVKWNQADSLKPLEEHKLKIKKPHNEAVMHYAKWRQWVLGDAGSLEEDAADPTHIVNKKTNVFRKFKKNAAVSGSEVAIRAEPLPPMTAALGPQQIPSAVWKTKQGSFLIESPEFKGSGQPVLSFEQQPISERRAKSLMMLPSDAVQGAQVQLQLFTNKHDQFGWVATKPGSFWMVVSPDTGSFAPLPSFGVRLVPCKKSKKLKKYKSLSAVAGSECVTGENSDLHVVTNQNMAVLDNLTKDVEDTSLWEQIRMLCVENTPSSCLGFVRI